MNKRIHTPGIDNFDLFKNSPIGLKLLNLSSFQLVRDNFTASNMALAVAEPTVAEGEGVVVLGLAWGVVWGVNGSRVIGSKEFWVVTIVGSFIWILWFTYDLRIYRKTWKNFATRVVGLKEKAQIIAEMSIREEMIGNAVEFLLDPRVASSAEDKKRKWVNIIVKLNFEFFFINKLDF